MMPIGVYMSDVVIKVENLTKEYRLGVINHGTLAKDLQAWWARKRGKDDPNSPITINKYSSATDSVLRTPNTEKTDSHGLRPSDSEQRKNNNDDLSVSSEARSVIKNDENAFNDKENRCTSEARSVAKNDKIYALKDINFEVRQGEVLGIIGANGAGKSTLLKILSRVTSPTSGCVKIKGRIGSLLEVGTGFHPELTGRENIYLNGAILGMKRWEIEKKLDEIIDFSGVEKFIDTPVKRYSSGMYVRLAFAVAAHLDPEILVIDEVLAVGDAEFQKKCLGKMGDISKKEGRTVLFVSHNMTAIKALSKRSICLQNGIMVDQGETNKVIEKYLSLNRNESLKVEWNSPEEAPGNEFVRIKRAEIIPSTPNGIIRVDTPFNIEFEVWNLMGESDLNFSLHVYNMENVMAFNTYSSVTKVYGSIFKGVCEIPAFLMNDETYTMMIMVVKHSKPLLTLHNILSFKVEEIERKGNWYGKHAGILRPKLNWKTEVY